jgi:GT2 family glycosyltransferase
MDRHKDAAMGTGQIRYHPQINTIWYAGGALVGWRGLAVHFSKDKDVNKIMLGGEPEYVTFISGCYLCIRTSEIKRLGLLEEKFFLYLEDIEYSSRAVKNNLKLLYVPRSIIYHKCRGERQLRNQTLYYAVRNRSLLIDLSFPSIAKTYYFLVIRIKMIYWYFTNNDFFTASRKGLKDYKNNVFGKYK